jgi:hypothetical protein
MTLYEKQVEFSKLVPLLINKAFELGYTVTLGEVYRSPEEAKRLAKLGKGIENSLHTVRLAIDLNLFRNGTYLTDNEAHRTLGTYWESLSNGKPFTTYWGGHFGDGNHYSITHENRK